MRSERERAEQQAAAALGKAQAVLRLLRGEDLELLSRELGGMASTLSLGREQFLAAGQDSSAQAFAQSGRSHPLAVVKEGSLLAQLLPQDLVLLLEVLDYRLLG